MMPTGHSIYSHTLSALLHDFTDTNNLQDVKVTGITSDSRMVKTDDLFIAYPHANALNHINMAIEQGASAVAFQITQSEDIPKYTVPIVALPQLQVQAGLIASRFFDHPTDNLNVIGVTGTNGKTTVSHLITHALEQHNPGKNSVIGTLGYGHLNDLAKSPNTTPDAITLHSILAEFCQQEIDTVTMEVSSHGLDQHRVSGVEFDIAVFTNLSRDHLDYHKNMDAYMESKRRLFNEHIVNHAVINCDDAYGIQLCKQLPQKMEIVAYTLNADKHYDYPTITAQTSYNHNGLTLEIDSPWGNGVLHSDMMGRFNAENLLASLAVLCLSDIEFTNALGSLSKAPYLAGRMEFLRHSGKPTVVIDYAHTPDSLKQILQSLRAQSPAKLICIFGCGGQRDKGKRAEMGRVAERFADQVVLTNDNPRYEAPQTIIEDITKGIKNHNLVTQEMDRKHAITMTIHAASKDDLILVAGKGHEDYQEVDGVKIPFNDSTIVKETIYQSNGDIDD